jgi:hypothetical protein
VYKVQCIEPSSGAGMFAVYDPAGVMIGTYSVGAAAFATQIKFTIADGSPDFAGGDFFNVTVTIAAGSGQYVKSLAASTDGSEAVTGVLAEAITATAATTTAMIIAGELNENALTFGTGHTADSTRDAFQAIGIILRDSPTVE